MSSLHLNKAFTLHRVYTVGTKHQPSKGSPWKELQTLYFSPWTVIPFIMGYKMTFLLHQQEKEKIMTRTGSGKVDSPHRTLSITGALFQPARFPSSLQTPQLLINTNLLLLCKTAECVPSFMKQQNSALHIILPCSLQKPLQHHKQLTCFLPSGSCMGYLKLYEVQSSGQHSSAHGEHWLC